MVGVRAETRRRESPPTPGDFIHALALMLRVVIVASVLGIGLDGCAGTPRTRDGSIPSVTFAPAVTSASAPLVIVLPGRGDDLRSLTKSGIAEAIQQAMPEAEVVLAGATLDFYKDGLIERLDQQFVAPARARGVQEIWMAGISMGGMGTILYEHFHPGELTGLVLFSPYMGDADLVKAVAADGVPPSWDPGPLPVPMDADGASRAEWVTVKSWSQQPELARRVWFVCGASDRFQPAARMIEPWLPADQVWTPPGGHSWSVWLPASRTVFAAIEAHRVPLDGSRGQPAAEPRAAEH